MPVKRDKEEPAREKSSTEAAYDLLKSKKFLVKKVYRVYAAGDLGYDKQTILWVNEGGKARTSYIEVEWDEDEDEIVDYSISTVTKHGWF